MSEFKLTKEYQELILDHDLKYFLEKNITDRKPDRQYSDENVKEIYDAYRNQSLVIQTELKKNRKQYNLWLYGAFVHMFEGRLIPSLLGINSNAKELTIFDFTEMGKNWAYFDAWQKHERNKRRKKKIWDVVVKIGTALAFMLSAIKVIELFG